MTTAYQRNFLIPSVRFPHPYTLLSTTCPVLTLLQQDAEASVSSKMWRPHSNAAAARCWSLTMLQQQQDAEASLYCRSSSKKFSVSPNPGTVENNPRVEDAVCLSITFHKYNRDQICYPPFANVLEVAAQHTDLSSASISEADKSDGTIRKAINSAMVRTVLSSPLWHLDLYRVFQFGRRPSIFDTCCHRCRRQLVKGRGKKCVGLCCATSCTSPAA